METINFGNFANFAINDNAKCMSISNVLDTLSKSFDKQGTAQKLYDNQFNNPNAKYYHMTVEQIIESWEAKGAESCRYGSLLDDYIGLQLTDPMSLELYKLDNGYDWDERLHGLCDSFDNFYSILSKSGDIIFIDRERTVYYKVDEEHYIKGRFDALFRNQKTGKWIVIDWKSSGDIEKFNKYEKFRGPAIKLDACNWNRYTMQLHFYKKALIESGYLPEGTTEDDVEVLIVHMPGHIIEGVGQNYQICKEAFKYNSKFMDDIFGFAIRRNALTNK